MQAAGLQPVGEDLAHAALDAARALEQARGAAAAARREHRAAKADVEKLRRKWATEVARLDPRSQGRAAVRSLISQRAWRLVEAAERPPANVGGLGAAGSEGSSVDERCWQYQRFRCGGGGGGGGGSAGAGTQGDAGAAGRGGESARTGACALPRGNTPRRRRGKGRPPCLALPCLALPCLAFLPCLASPTHASPCVCAKGCDRRRSDRRR